MADFPIIFSAPMVRALLDGRKTMTRRLAWRVAPVWCDGGPLYDAAGGQEDYIEPHWVVEGVPSHWRKAKPGDRLWVKENVYRFGGPIEYAADGPPSFERKMTPCIHCPRTLSRLTLVVTATKIEQIWSLSTADERAEGFDNDGTAFSDLWDKLHGPGAWDANPEVVALSFQVHRANIDQMQKEAA